MDSGDQSARDPLGDWQLMAIVSVDKTARVQCQCRGCGLGVYRAIHMIQWPSAGIECWGGQCYKRELGSAAQERGVEPMFSMPNGRQLTDAEREMLANNRDDLIAWFRAQQEQSERERAAEEAVERARIERQEAAQWAAYEQRSRDSAPVRPQAAKPHRARRDAAGAPTRPSPEPANDPRYVAIRQRLEARWRANGIDPESTEGRRSLVENALSQYDRGR